MKSSLRLAAFLTLASLTSGLSQAALNLHPAENVRYTGRVQFTREPGQGAGSLLHVDQRFPVAQGLRVGPSGRSGVGLAMLLAFEITDEARAALATGAKAELVIHVRSAAMGGSPSPLRVVLLESGAYKSEESFSWFGAWNVAPALTDLGTIDGDPDLGPCRFDASAALLAGRQTSEQRPLVYFAVHGPLDDLADMNTGRHVLFEGAGPNRPALVLTPRR